jgi:hypothetical protein
MLFKAEDAIITAPNATRGEAKVKRQHPRISKDRVETTTTTMY